MAREFCMLKSNNMRKIMLPNYTKNSAKTNKKHKILFGSVIIMALTTPPTVVVDTIGVGSFLFHDFASERAGEHTFLSG